MHFLVQSVPILPVTRIVTIIKSMTARYVLDKIPELKRSCGEQIFGQVAIMLQLLENMGMKQPLQTMLRSKDVNLNTFRFTKTN